MASLFAYAQLGFLTLLSSIYIICCKHLRGPTSISVINTGEDK